MSRFIRLIKHDAFGGMILILSSFLALAAANSSFEPLFTAIFEHSLPLDLYFIVLDKSLSHWINDGLMALFFLFVSIEIKRELKTGALSSWKKASLPLVAACGGMVIPALMFLIYAGNAGWHQGWAIPMATDIAFALGVLSLLGRRVPAAAKIFLLALAVIDDFGAITVIGLFYTEQLHLMPLMIAGGLTAFLLILNRLQIKSLPIYAIVGVILWVAILKSGIHATIAGVIVGFVLPQPQRSVIHLEHQLSYLSKFLILPLFALANAGIALTGDVSIVEGVSSAVILGLVAGKPIGIILFCWIAYKLKWVHLPDSVNWGQLIGVAILCGIGFTMSIFISNLAFPADAHTQNLAKAGILSASALAAVLGYVWLFFAGKSASNKGEIRVSS